MTSLFIDTKDSNRIIVCIKKDEEEYCETEVANKMRAQMTLPLIENLVKKSGIELAEIEEINVDEGPGSFTGLRVGVSIANALSFAGLKKINGKEVGNIEQPNY